MNRKYLYAIIITLILFTSANAQKKLENLKDSASYAMGYNLGQTVSKRYPGMDLTLIIKGLGDAYGLSKDSLVKPEAIPAILTQYGKEQVKMQAMENRAAGEKFLQENAVKPGVVKTASGLQYIVLRQGTGPKPDAGNRVKVNYLGTLINGKEFDNSYRNGQPVEFAVTGVIKGWSEALLMMPVGSKYKLFIPSELAYGENGMGGGLIPPASVLIFEVELLEIM